MTVCGANVQIVFVFVKKLAPLDAFFLAVEFAVREVMNKPAGLLPPDALDFMLIIISVKF